MRSIIVISMVMLVTFNVINGMALPRSHYNRVHLSRRALHSHNPSVSVLRRDLIPVLSETVQEEVFDDQELVENVDGLPEELVEAKKVKQEAMDQVLELPFEKRLKIGKIFKKAVSVAGSIGKTAVGMAMGG